VNSKTKDEKRATVAGQRLLHYSFRLFCCCIKPSKGFFVIVLLLLLEQAHCYPSGVFETANFPVNCLHQRSENFPTFTRDRPSTVKSFKFFFVGAAKYRAMRESEVHDDGSEEVTGREGFGKSIKDFPIALWTLLKNPVYAFTCLAGCSETMVVAGFTTFLPKIIENQYQQSASVSAIMAGKL